MKFVILSGIISTLIASIESRKGEIHEILNTPCKVDKDCAPVGADSEFTFTCDRKVNNSKKPGYGDCRLAKFSKCLSQFKKYKYDLETGFIIGYTNIQNTCESGLHCKTETKESLKGVCTANKFKRRRF